MRLWPDYASDMQSSIEMIILAIVIFAALYVFGRIYYKLTGKYFW